MEGWRIGRIRGISVEINYTWLLMIALFTWVFTQFLRSAPAASPAWYWIAGGVTSLFFVLSVFLHEMSHSLVALSLGVPVKRITLFIFGGVAQIEGEVPTPKGEFVMAAAGPALSVALWGLFSGLVWIAGQAGASELVVSTLGLLALINLRLAQFNLLPGLPLDGGRILHSILWRIMGDEFRATRVAGFFGQVLGAGLIALGGLSVLLVPGGGWGLWILFIGWLILSVAGTELRQNRLKQALSGLQVGQVMFWPLVTLPPDLTLEQALRWGRQRPQPLYPVVEPGGAPVGLLDQSSLQQAPPEQWATVTVEQVMHPLNAQQDTVRPEAPATEALMRMARAGREYLLVVTGEDQPLGLVTQHSILAATQRPPSPFGGG